jgi:protein-L-isoaspartate(D-aspartate) O-methyltransferase
MRAIGLAFLLVFTRPLLGQDLQALQRERMVSEQIELRGIRNRDVLRVMRSTPRHLFVPPDVRANAYDDRPLPIGHRATISQPYIVALMTELLDLSPHHKVLEIGTGSGYQAAILAKLSAEVYSIEIEPELARSAAEILRKLGHPNVRVRHGDGYQGWPEHAPFDRIILTAAPPQIPQALLSQLARRGRLVAPEGASLQKLVVVEKRDDGTFSRKSVTDVTFVPMRPGRY